MSPKNGKSILLVRLDHIGDCVLTVPPVVAALRKRSPEARIELLTLSHGEMLLRDDPEIDHIIVYDAPWSLTPKGVPRCKRAIRYLMSFVAFVLRRWAPLWRYYDVVVCLSFSPWERLLTWPLGRRRVGFDGPYMDRFHRMSAKFLTDRVLFDGTKHMVENCLNLVDCFLPGGDRAFVVRLCMDAERKACGRDRIRKLGFDPEKTIAIHPSSNGSMKGWPMPRPIELGHILSAEPGWQVLFVMSPGEYEAIAQPIDELERKHSNVRHLVTESFADLAQVIANVRLLVANDGGPMHIASALGVPTVAIFGPTDERLYSPLSPTSRVLRSGYTCGGKHRPWRVECDCPGKVCLAALTPDMVARCARELLNGTEKDSVASGHAGDL